MPDCLAALHDAHHGCLRLVTSIGSNALVRLFVLLERLFELDGVDLDAILFVLEGLVERESVCVFNVATLGMLRDRAQLGTSQRLEGAFDFGFGCVVVSRWKVNLTGRTYRGQIRS